MEHVATLEVHYQSHVAMPLTDGEFVDSEISDLCETPSFVPFAKVVLEYLFHQVPPDSQKAGHVFDGGDSAQIDHEAFKGFDVTFHPTSKWDWLPQSSTTARALLVVPVKDDEHTTSTDW